MKSYLIDEVHPRDMEKIEAFLNNRGKRSEIERLFWVEMPEDHLNEIQVRHRECHPHMFAVELGQGWIKAELFTRTLNDLNCPCNGYCTIRQMEYVFNFMEDMIGELDIRT